MKGTTHRSRQRGGPHLPQQTFPKVLLGGPESRRGHCPGVEGNARLGVRCGDGGAGAGGNGRGRVRKGHSTVAVHGQRCKPPVSGGRTLRTSGASAVGARDGRRAFRAAQAPPCCSAGVARRRRCLRSRSTPARMNTTPRRSPRRQSALRDSRLLESVVFSENRMIGASSEPAGNLRVREGAPVVRQVTKACMCESHCVELTLRTPMLYLAFVRLSHPCSAMAAKI